MANDVKLTFVGDSKSLEGASRQSAAAVERVGAAATSASQDFQRASGSSGDLVTKLGSLGAGMEGLTGGIESVGGAFRGLADLQSFSARKADELARAQTDVAQAQEDMAQSTRDASQAGIDQLQSQEDAKQAALDQRKAIDDYQKAVKKHGAGSIEAAQAQRDLSQAGIDLKQAQEDSAQATRDAAQASIDGKVAQVDLNESMRAANPPKLEQYAQMIEVVTPILTGLVGIIGLVAAAQWLWNAAQLASPTTWIILAIIALVAIIVVIATKTTWFQTIWKKAWEGIQLYITVFKAVWSGIWNGIVASFNFLKSVVTGYANYWVNSWTRIINFVKSVPGKVVGFFSGLKQKFISVGGGIIDGMISGVKNKIGQLASVAANAAKSALKAAKNFLGISSPSKLFRDQVGANMALGISEGFTDKLGTVRAAIETVPIGPDVPNPGAGAMAAVSAGPPAGGGARERPIELVAESATDADRAMAAWLQRLARDGRLKGLVTA